ncbi:hypothetical protein [Rhodococcus xishaensis]|nr:hypothetical protein [Rhodococcus xishaensis]
MTTIAMVADAARAYRRDWQHSSETPLTKRELEPDPIGDIRLVTSLAS